MLQSLRPLLTKILNPIARNLNINPNIVTVISPFVAVIAAYGFANHLLILGTIAILFSGFLDVVDGAVARYHDKASKFGAFLAESQGVDCNVGIAERAVRMIILMIGALIGYFAGDIYFTYIIYILVVLSYFTVAQRILHVWRKLND